jgi:hypothetical protein
MWAMVWWYELRQTPNSSTRAIWQPPVLSGDPVSRDISGVSRRMGEGNENLVYPTPWDFKISVTCHKILRHGTSGFTSHPKEGVLRIFIALKIHRLGRIRLMTFGSSGKHTNHYTTEATMYTPITHCVNCIRNICNLYVKVSELVDIAELGGTFYTYCEYTSSWELVIGTDSTTILQNHSIRTVCPLSTPLTSLIFLTLQLCGRSRRPCLNLWQFIPERKLFYVTESWNPALHKLRFLFVLRHVL